LLLPYFEDNFIIINCGGDFPDAIMLRNGDEIGVEFEVYTSNFFMHGHHKDPRLNKCNLIVVWRNNLPKRTILRNGMEYLKVNDTHYIEVLALDKIIKRLEKEKSIKVLFMDYCPSIKSNEEKFFSQLEESVNSELYNLINELYKYVKARKKDFNIEWSSGRKWHTMRIQVRRWDVSVITIDANGHVWLNYTGNPTFKNYWELPQETKEKLRRLFKHGEETRWTTVPLKDKEDLERIKEALDILAKDSEKYRIIKM